MRCPYCGGYTFNSDGVCLSCGHTAEKDKPRSSLGGDVDIFKLAEGLQKRDKSRQQESIRLFTQTECSWCGKFYTQPFLCPYSRLQSDCISCSKITVEQRDKLISEETWHWRMGEMLKQVSAHGVMGRCRSCGALNPNPQKHVCWRCRRDTICCPRDGLVLRYDIEGKFWKCTNAGCPTNYGDIQEAPPAPYTSMGERSRRQEKLAQDANSVLLKPTSSVPNSSAKDECPKCKQKTLTYNSYKKRYECENPDCLRIFQEDELAQFRTQSTGQQKKAEGEPVRSTTPTEKPLQPDAVLADKPPMSPVTPPMKKAGEAAATRDRMTMPKWMIPLLTVFALSVAGIAASVIIGSSIPFLLLFGLSIFFSIEKWYIYETRKNKALGQLYRTALNLSILSLLGMLIWSGVALTSLRFLSNPLAGAIVFLAELAFFVWLWRVISRNSWRKPSMKLTVFSIVVVLIVFSFAGVEPMKSYKDQVFKFISSWFSTVTSDSGSFQPWQPTATAPRTTPGSAVSAPTTQSPLNPTTAMTSSNYAASREQAVTYVLSLINGDRVANGLGSVVLGTNSAAQQHADDMLKYDYMAHWDTAGMKPYMRYTLTGGFNYEAENVFSHRTAWYGGKDPFYKIDLYQTLDEAESSLMASPGHRRNILNQWHKKVNIGLVYDNEKLFLVQQFEGDYITFIREPALTDGILFLSGAIQSGFTLDQVQVWHDVLPHTLTVGQLENTYAYWSGKPLAFIREPAAPGYYYTANISLYDYETYADPYRLPSDISRPVTGTTQISSSTTVLVSVQWVDANVWNVNSNSFSIQADLRNILADNGKGVYTFHIWATTENESIPITNYSIFVR